MTNRTKMANIVVAVALAILFGGPMVLFLSGVRNTTTIDNRALAPLPEFSVKSLVNTDYYAKLKTYLVDRFPYRPLVIRKRGDLLQDIMRDFNSDRVVWGRDNWMFLREAIRFSCDKPRLVVHAVSGMRIFSDYLRGLGKDVVFMIAPNKSTIYPDKVAQRFGKYLECEDRHRRAFHMMLGRRRDIKYLDVFMPTHAAVKSWPKGVYHWFDNHWDCRGSAVLGNLILRDFYGDLARDVSVVYRTEARISDISTVLGRPFKANWTGCRSALNNVQKRRLDDGKDRYFSSYVSNAEQGGQSGNTHALLIHDSFANGLRRFMPQVIPRLTMYNINNRDFVKLARAIKSSDKVYVEIVERTAYANFFRLGHPQFLALLKRAIRGLPP